MLKETIAGIPIIDSRYICYREGRFMGILEVSRSFGDGPYKKHGITVVPDVKRCTFTKNDRYENSSGFYFDFNF